MKNEKLKMKNEDRKRIESFFSCCLAFSGFFHF